MQCFFWVIFWGLPQVFPEGFQQRIKMIASLVRKRIEIRKRMDECDLSGLFTRKRENGFPVLVSDRLNGKPLTPLKERHVSERCDFS